MKKIMVVILVLCWYLSGIGLNPGSGNSLQGLLKLNSSIDTAYAQSSTQHSQLNGSVLQTSCQGLEDQLTRLQQTFQFSVEMRRVSLDQRNQTDIDSTIANLSRETEQAQVKFATCLLKTQTTLTTQPNCQRLQNQFVQLRQNLLFALELRKVLLNPDFDQSNATAINATIQGFRQQISLVQGELSTCLNGHSSPAA